MKKTILSLFALLALFAFPLMAGLQHPVETGTAKAKQLDIQVTKRPMKHTGNLEVTVSFAETYQRNAKSRKLPIGWVKAIGKNGEKTVYKFNLKAIAVHKFEISEAQFKNLEIVVQYDESVTTTMPDGTIAVMESGCPPTYSFKPVEFVKAATTN